MLITEDEAKKKWCPMGRSLVANGTASAAINRTDRGAPVGLCVAGACMFWREQINKVSPIPGVEMKQDEHGKLYAETKVGYCGAAGVPFIARATR